MKTPGGAHADETAEELRPPPGETIEARADLAPAPARPPRPAAGGDRAARGARFDGYEVLGELGRGGVGVVLRARDQIGREVALKTLLGLDQDSTALTRFRREAEALAALDHPNVIKVHAAGDVAGRPYVVFELIPGARPLDELDPGTPLETRVALVRDVARALGHAHARGIVHRDVKASNLLVDDTGRVRVTDFGLAMFEDRERLTRTGFMVGTPLAMAPEQIAADRAAIGPASDVWGLGVVLYQALTGRAPFDGETLPALIKMIRQGRPVPPRRCSPEVPPLLEAVCLRALEPRPRDRWADGDAMADALDAALRGEAAGARPRRWLTWLVGGAALGIVIVSGLLATAGPWSGGAPATPSEAAPPAPSPAPSPSEGPLETDAVADRRARVAAAADGGDPEAMVEHGDLLAAGQGGAVDLAAALARFRRAAELGHGGAAVRLARRHHAGDGAPKDLDEAIRWLRRAVEVAEADGPRALARTLRMDLGDLLFERGRLEDISEAGNLMARTGEEGEPRAMLRHAEYLAAVGLVVAARKTVEELTRQHPAYEPERADALRRKLGLPTLR